MASELNPRAQLLIRIGAGLLVLGFVAFVLHATPGLRADTAGAVFEIWIYDALMVGAAGACLLRALLVERERTGWALLGLALCANAAGEIYYAAAITGSGEVPIPSPADVGYLAFYPIAYAALIVLVRERIGSFPAVRWLDGLIVGGAVATLAAALALGPIVDSSTTGSSAAVATNLAYPIADLTLLALVVTVSSLTGWRPGASWLCLAAGLLVLAVSDVVYLLQSAQGTYVEGGLLDAAWPLGMLLLAAAAWVRPGALQPMRRTAGGSALLPAAAALTAIGILFAGRSSEIPLAAEILSLLTLLGVVLRFGLALRETRQSLEASVREALSDPLTGLGNRRHLMEELEVAVAAPVPAGKVRLLAIFDLDGFKAYNDAFGHPAGDALLTRLGGQLATFAEPYGVAYRLGGDEFCLLAECTATEVDAIIAGAQAALSEHGEGFQITAAQGSALIPGEAHSREGALQLADRRMYANKGHERSSAGAQSQAVLVSALRERQPQLHEHLDDIARLAVQVAEALGMSAEQRDEVLRAAELHDTGKVAIPDAVLNKPGPLEETEWDFVRKHPLIGERIISAAPALAPVARLVRSSHEHWDGSGYPDGLAGEQIPLGARIVAVCAAFQAMVSERPYSVAMRPERALEEICREGGSQFDPKVAEAFCTIARGEAADTRTGGGRT